MTALRTCAAAVGLAALAWVVFRVVVRRAYRRAGRLGAGGAALELLVWAAFFAFPYLYNPPQWAAFWSDDVPVGPLARAIGRICVGAGFVLAFGTMAWFGLRRALGGKVEGLVERGPYRLSRNPQLVGCVPLVTGMIVLWPSWYAALWAVLGALAGHLMVRTEEEHLGRVFGEEYARYCARVPRYLGWSRSR